MQDYRGLRVYHAAMRLAREAYVVAAAMPVEERFKLASQLRSAAMSVGSNIAEGCGRDTPRDMCCFLDRALGSANEVESQVSHVLRVGMAPPRPSRTARQTAQCTQRMLTALVRKIRRDNGLDQDGA